MISDDLGGFERADEMLRDAVKGYEMACNQENLQTPSGQRGRAQGRGRATARNMPGQA